jgi:putative glutamine amidotransferase
MPAKMAVSCGDRNKVAPYASAVREAGLEPVLVSPRGSIGLASFDGLLLTGGTDIDPEKYGQARDRAAQAPDGDRDDLELRLARWALYSDVPVLAICRGLQLINVACGGTLIQHVDGHRRQREYNAHPVDVAAGTVLAGIVGAGAYWVNSRHHQAVDRVGEGLVVSARSEDGLVEGLEFPGRRFAVAVQWHPEDRTGAGSNDGKLFQALADAVAERRRERPSGARAGGSDLTY